jgi:AsmA protein
VTAATGLKRLAIAVAAMLAAASALLIGLAVFVPAAAVRNAVSKEIHAVTGLDPALHGQVSVSLFPAAKVIFHDVRLGDDGSGEPAVVADEMIAHLHYFPLLAGRVEIADITLLRPTITVTLQSSGTSNWSGLLDSLAHALAPDRNRTDSFSEIGIRDGVVIVHNRSAGKSVDGRLDSVDFQLAWPSISRSFGANGRFVWHDEPIDASLTLSDFLAALTGDRTGVKLRLSGAPIKIAFDGSASYQPTLKMEGTLNADSPSLRDAILWTDGKELPFGGFGRFALRAHSEIGGGTMALNNVNVELDGNRAEGALTLATDEHRMVQGTLAADALDLTSYVSPVHLFATNERNWDSAPVALDGFNGFDLDLRLSAASVKIANAQLSRTAVAATIRDGKLDVTVGESQAFGGLVKGSLGLASVNDGVGVQSHLQFVDVDLDSCLGQLFRLHRLTGHGTLAVDVEGSGSSILALTNTLTGTASLTAHDGALTGINVEQLLQRLERRPLGGSGDFRSGETPFDQLSLSVKLAQGMASVETMRIDGPAVRLTLGGQASVPTRDLDLKGVATLISKATANEFDLPFVVQGSWDDPSMLPDAQILIRRSGAAAPLLESIKDRSVSSAVHSVLDRILAAPTVSTAPTPPARAPQ